MTPALVLPVSRGRSLVRAVLMLSGALASAFLVFVVGEGLKFRPSAVSNRIEDYALACLMIPVAVMAAYLAWRGAAWLALACWPGRLGIEVSNQSITFRTGPFGTVVYDARRLVVAYPYQLSADDESMCFEKFLPQQEQERCFLPRITHPDARRSIRQDILRFAKGAEPSITEQLLPFISRWRAGPPGADQME